LRNRLESAFAARGMLFSDHCIVIPWLDKPMYYGLMRCSDVMLDTIGCSGFNTAMQAMECALPIVTREGEFMRGRFASGILRTLGLPDLGASDEQEYIKLAVSIAGSVERRRDIRSLIESRRGLLFGDIGTVSAFEEWLLEMPKNGAVKPETTSVDLRNL
jgi:predicted O-linked N-acetylglucosamine transferase (SPINDLY family)